VLEIRDAAQFSAGGKRSAPSQAAVFFASETPLNPFGKSAATVHDESRRGGRARKAPRRVQRAKSHPADVTTCAADWSDVGGPTRERKQEPYRGQRVQE
jgi:hypothetical protein